MKIYILLTLTKKKYFCALSGEEHSSLISFLTTFSNIFIYKPFIFLIIFNSDNLKNVMKSNIFKYLSELGLTSIKTRKLFSNKTRDMKNLNVWRDEMSGVIYIDEYVPDNNVYEDGNYRIEDKKSIGNNDFELKKDAERRYDRFLPLVADKKVLDFGSEAGKFLELVKPYCKYVVGIELDSFYINYLLSKNIDCFSSLELVPDNTIDVIVSFHTLEHLSDPIELLTEMKKKLTDKGRIIVEVPHANDFLIHKIQNEEFINFTLWSQHLVLHTRNSLYRTLDAVGFKNIQIEGVQRYSLSNHIQWLTKGVPAGHKSNFSFLDTKKLSNAYSDALSNIDSNDTLIAIAEID